MKKNLTTRAGPTEAKIASGDDHINAINQVFAIFRRNYHNQYYKAFPDERELSITKRLWLESLQKFSAQSILQAARSVIESSEFLPTLRTMINHCELQNDLGLPDPHQAYIEACRAPSPKAEYQWSHLAVYYAGKECDWFFLQSNSENTAFPVFKKAYERICREVREGRTLQTPSMPAIAANSEKILDKHDNLSRLESFKKRLGDL